MKIDPQVLSEKNYEGSRLIPVENEKLLELQAELDVLQKEINPVLEKLSADYYPVVDPLYTEVRELTAKTRDIRAKIDEKTKEFKADTDKIEAVEQKAQLIKDKMQPLILKEIESSLGEFEIARHTIVKGGKIFVEVFDELEEKVKAIRAQKANKK